MSCVYFSCCSLTFFALFRRLVAVLETPEQEVTSAKEMRAKLENETPTAGPGLITPNMELFCKAAADGSALGDCPFTHFIQVRVYRTRK